MNKWIALATALAVSLLVGCGQSKTSALGTGDEAGGAATKDGKAVVGLYVFKFTSEVEEQLKQNEDALQALKAKAAAGDKAAIRRQSEIPKDAAPERRLLEGMALRLDKEKSFLFELPDRTTGKIRKAVGTYVVDPSGAKLTLTFTALDGKKAEGVDAKSLTMTFDEKERTVTADTGGGPKLVMQKR